jgi:hypothetical protein
MLSQLPAQSPDPKQPTPQKQTPCPNGAAAQSNRQTNITSGAAAGFSVFAIAGGVVVANLIGFPEVEVAEAIGGPELILLLTETRGLDAVAVGAVNAGAYGAVVGGGVGAALPASSGCP